MEEPTESVNPTCMRTDHLTSSCEHTPDGGNHPTVMRLDDDKGRIHVHLMSERELLEEVVTNMRETRDLVESFVETMSRNPMLRGMAGMFGR